MLNSRAIKEIVRQYNLAISPRRLGQNFLVDPRILSRIVATVGATSGDSVLEIGAGLGALTEGLLATGATIHAVERDARFIRVLSDRFKPASRFKDAQNLKLIQSDVLKLDLGTIASQRPKSLLVVGNIPFSMTSRILEYLLRQRIWVKRAVLTVQKEVAQRIVAQVGTKAYSSITLLVQVAFKPSIAFFIPPNCFYPQPKVTSSVLSLDPLPAPVVPPEEEEAVLKLVRRIFTHRRKTILNALSLLGDMKGARSETPMEGARSLTWHPPQKQELLQRLAQASIDPTRRPETLHLHELLLLHRCLNPLI